MAAKTLACGAAVALADDYYANELANVAPVVAAAAGRLSDVILAADQTAVARLIAASYAAVVRVTVLVIVIQVCFGELNCLLR